MDDGVLLSIIDKGKNIAALLVAVGVAGEFLGDFMADPIRKRRDEARQADIVRLSNDAETARKDSAKLRLDISKSDERAAHANERIALAEQHAAEANRIAEGERLARVKIEEKIAPRRLSAEQIRTVADKLRRFTGQRLNFFATAGDAEAIGIADDILKALNGPNSAGWFPTLSTGQYSSLVGSGIVIELSSDADARAREAAVTLAEALRSERLAVLGPQPPPNMQTMVGNINNDPQARIRLVVAKKP
jgi:hypothetical protein